MKSIKCNIIKAGRGDVYGRPFAIGQIYTGPFDYVRQLVSCGYATVDDAAVFDDDSTPQNSEIAIVGKGRMAVEAELNEVTGRNVFLGRDGKEILVPEIGDINRRSLRYGQSLRKNNRVNGGKCVYRFQNHTALTTDGANIAQVTLSTVRGGHRTASDPEGSGTV